MPTDAKDTKTDNRVPKYIRIDRDLDRAVRIFAAEHDMRVTHVIEKALRAFLSAAQKPDANG